MSLLIEPPTTQPAHAPTRRPLHKRIIHTLRRGHLYFGLFLFPWAILYGITAFLFNHPTAFPDQVMITYDRDSLLGTPMEVMPSPTEQATTLIAALNASQKPEMPYRLKTGEATYATRDFIFGTIKADTRTFSVLYDVKASTGTIRETTPKTVTKPGPKAPFATGKAPAPRERGMGTNPGMTQNHSEKLKVGETIADRFKATIPMLMSQNGYPTGEVTVTSTPDIRFPIEAGGETWTATYNPLTGVVTGSLPEVAESDLSIRRFLLRMHLTHGYPGEYNAKWFWALIVDAMAIVMCFWGLTGLIMWWQIKATRKLGLAVLSLSAITATMLGIAMYALLS